MDKLDIIDTYVYGWALKAANTAILRPWAVLKNVINLMLVLLTNWFAKRIGQSGLF